MDVVWKSQRPRDAIIGRKSSYKMKLSAKQIQVFEFGSQLDLISSP